VLKNFSSYTPMPQDETKATYCKKITKQDGLIEFDDAIKVYNKYRAFTPWPGVYLESGLKLKKMQRFIENEYFPSAKILEIGSDFIVVGANKGALKILRVQPVSKKEMDVISYINGKRLKVGDTLS
jgi:methionyl-tRNA formyltransferase